MSGRSSVRKTSCQVDVMSGKCVQELEREPFWTPSRKSILVDFYLIIFLLQFKYLCNSKIKVFCMNFFHFQRCIFSAQNLMSYIAPFENLSKIKFWVQIIFERGVLQPMDGLRTGKNWVDILIFGGDISKKKLKNRIISARLSELEVWRFPTAGCQKKMNTSLY